MNKTQWAEVLSRNTREGELYEKRSDGKTGCYACGHRCVIADGQSGICRMRFNRKGKLYAPFGYVAGLHADPIEKKPFYHVLPGSLAMSFGMLGCNFHCPFCQNWVSSQVLRDDQAVAVPETLRARDIVELAFQYDCKIITSTYNEPLITSEWAVEIFKEAKKAGFLTAYVSNGNATPEVLDYLKPWLDLFKVDLKSFDESRYRELGGSLENICRSIRQIQEKGFWLEVVTLLVPGFNDSDDELKKLADFLVSVSPEIPWHCTAFHKDYKMTGPDNTPAGSLMRAAAIGKKAGLRYVYAGNLPGRVAGSEDTYCPECHEILIRRAGFRILEDKLTPAAGVCFKCRVRIPGVWTTKHPFSANGV